MSDRPPNRDASSHATVAGSRRAYAVVLLLVTVFILYGALFPFEYYERTFPGGPFGYLMSTWQDWDRRADLLSNILLYIPFGFFAVGALTLRIPAALRVVIATVAGTLLSCGMELLQFHDVGRVSTLGDVYADAIGTAIGAVAAALIGASMRWPFMRELGAHPTACILLVMFFGYRLYPYVPTTDLHKFWHAVQPMLLAPSLPPYELTRFVITWLFIAVIIHSLYGYRRFLLLFPLLCGFEFLGRILIVSIALKLSDVVGAGAAYLLWSLLLCWIPGRFAIVALAFAGMIAAQRLEPFQFTVAPRDFGWVPFVSIMHGSINVAMQAFCEKFYEYGGLIWLLGRAGVRLPIGTALTMMLLFATSYAERWLPGRSAEITDLLMALTIGVAFAVLRHTARVSAGVSRASAAAVEDLVSPAAGVLAEHGAVSAAPQRQGQKYVPYVPPHLRG